MVPRQLSVVLLIEMLECSVPVDIITVNAVILGQIGYTCLLGFAFRPNACLLRAASPVRQIGLIVILQRQMTG